MLGRHSPHRVPLGHLEGAMRPVSKQLKVAVGSIGQGTGSIMPGSGQMNPVGHGCFKPCVGNVLVKATQQQYRKKRSAYMRADAPWGTWRQIKKELRKVPRRDGKQNLLQQNRTEVMERRRCCGLKSY